MTNDEYYPTKSGSFHTLVAVLQHTQGITSWNDLRKMGESNPLMDEAHFKKVAKTILRSYSLDGGMTAKYEGLQVTYIPQTEDYIISHVGYVKQPRLESKLAIPSPPTKQPEEYKPLYPVSSRKKNRNYTNGTIKRY